MFEALFDHGLGPTGAFADALEDAGYAPGKPEPYYPSKVWRAALEVGRRFAFPQLPDAESWRQLGWACSRGWFKTPLGPMFHEILPVLPPRGFFSRIDAYARMGRTDTEVEVLELLGDRVRFRLRDPVGVDGNFSVGALNSILDFMQLHFEGGVEGTPFDHVIHFQWWK
jgi:uncharacterized protein (TIGR02265 family)